MFLANIWTKNKVGLPGAELHSLAFSAPVARHCAFKLFVHGSNGKYRQPPKMRFSGLPMSSVIYHCWLDAKLNP
jgi:hypothetical protein